MFIYTISGLYQACTYGFLICITSFSSDRLLCSFRAANYGFLGARRWCFFSVFFHLGPVSYLWMKRTGLLYFGDLCNVSLLVDFDEYE